MDNETPRRDPIDDGQSQVESNRTKIDIPSTPITPTSVLPQEAPEPKTWSSSMINLEGGQKARFAPIRRQSVINYDPPLKDAQPSQPWLPQVLQYSSSPPYHDSRMISSPEPFIPSLGPQSPWPMPPTYGPQTTYTSDQHQNVRSHSLPAAPSHVLEPRPYFYTPQAGKTLSLSNPGHMSYQSPPYLSQQNVPLPQQQRSQSTSGHVVPQPIPRTNLGTPRRQRSRSALIDSASTTRQNKIFQETSRSFVAHDPFGVHSSNEEKTEKITFDDMPMSPTTGDWEQQQLYQNQGTPWIPPPQTPWFQNAPATPSSVPSSWGQLYSPFIPYSMTPHVTHRTSVQPMAEWDSASQSSSSHSSITTTSSVPIMAQYPNNQFVNEEKLPVSNPPSPQIPPKKVPNAEQSSRFEETQANESTTNSPNPEPLSGVPLPEDGETPYSPRGSPQHSPKIEENDISGPQPEDPIPASQDKGDDFLSSQTRPAPIFRTYVSVNPPESRFNGPYTEHPSVEPNKVEPGLYPYYFQVRNGPVEPSVVVKTSERSSFSTKLREFFRWPFSGKTSHFPSEFELPFYAYPLPIHTPKSSPTFGNRAVKMIRTTIPHQVYLHFLLRLPSLYFSRVARIFEEAELTLREIKKMALETGLKDKGQVDLHTFESKDVPLQYTKLKLTWEAFIDSVMREWKTFNIISVLLLSAILTILQIQSAAQNTITRYTALSSLICSLISLLFGCTYIIRFGTMRKTYKAAEWALEARQTRTTVWWNVWVLLAMPAIWLTWSIILYIVCIMSFVWQASANTDQNPPSQISARTLLAVRVTMSTVLGLGLLYGGLILSTFRRYGQVMDNAWQRRINNWITEKRLGSRSYYDGGFVPPPHTPVYRGASSTSFQPDQGLPTSSPYGWFGPQTPYQGVRPPTPPLFYPPPPPRSPPLQFPQPSMGPGPFQSSGDSDSEIPSPIKSLFLPQLSYSGVGYFSDRKDAIEEDPLSFFVPPVTEKRISEDFRTTASAPSFVASSDHQPPTQPAEAPLAVLPIAASSTSAFITSVNDIGPPINQEGDSANRAEKTNESENNALRIVRFRSPLISPEEPHFESSISGNDSEPPISPVLSNSPENKISFSTEPTNMLANDQPGSSTSIHRPKTPWRRLLKFFKR